MGKRLFLFWIPRRFLFGALMLAGLAAVAWFVAAPPGYPVIAPAGEAVAGKIIVIDPGHGGIDPGAKTDAGLCEKEIVLDIGLRLKRLLSRAGMYVTLTRENDVDLSNQPGVEGMGFATRKRADLSARVRMANEKKADLFLSIHANSFPGAVWSGAQTFYDQANEEGRNLAICVQTELVRQLGPNHRKAKTGRFRVLTDTHMPAALVEVGFLSNPREANLLADPGYRQRVAESIYQGLINYFVMKHQGITFPGESPDRRTSAAPFAGLVTVRPGKDEAILYFVGAGHEDCLVPEIRSIPGLSRMGSTAALCEAVARELFRGPGAESVLATALPGRARVLSVSFSNGCATVDISRELIEDFRGGGRSEELALYALVNTLTELTEVNSVRITVEGRRDVSLAGHVLLDLPFTRREDLFE